MPAGTFYQPGPDCGRSAPVQQAAAIDPGTGVVTWDTAGAEVVDTCAAGEPGCPSFGRRNLYSMQVMVGDGTTSVPVDFMIELVEEPVVLCPDGSKASYDADTGAWTCPNQPPQADFAYAADDLTVSFQSTARDHDGTVVRHAWDFGDGTGARGDAVVHTYRSAGTYNVTLTAYDDDGAEDAVTKAVTVVIAPKADFTYAARGTHVGFTDTSTDADGSVVSWFWDFGDGTNSTAQHPEHKYAPGTYTATLTVRDDDGATATRATSVTVPCRPGACPT